MSSPPARSGLLLSFYGDDFTGSTDVLEALARAGLRTVLFLRAPTPEQLGQWPGLRAFGVAGGSRTLSPSEMERELPAAFDALRAGGAPIIHYKVCSTFDSSPEIGSIGRAIEIGRRVLGERPTPLVVGAPVLGRYVVFGNLFARSGLDMDPFRLDRHPTMSRHPVTPMNEADLRRILAGQTRLPVELVDVLQLEAAGDGRWVANGQAGVAGGAEAPPPIVLFDTLRDAHLAIIGREIARRADEGGPLFVVGSSGVEYALVAHWAASAPGGREGDVDGTMPGRAGTSTLGLNSLGASGPAPGAVERIIGVSGSCSPVTDRQIGRALGAGFEELPVPADLRLGTAGWAGIVREARERLLGGRSLLLHTSRGPTDPRRVARQSVAEGEALGLALGGVLEGLLEASGLRRVVVCGGDTSMQVARALGIEALEYVGPMAPGSPLCRVRAPGRVADGCEIVCKGGQVGRDNFFLDVLRGGPVVDR